MGDATRDALQQRLLDEQVGIIELVRDLVRIPSENPPGDTRQAFQYVAGLLDREGIAYEIVAPEPSMPNLIAHLDGAGPGSHLVLNGHLDVFPVGERQRWSVDPFGAEIRDGRLYGRGANDMKAGSAASLWAFLALSRCREAWNGRLTLTLVSDEETFGPHGARYLVEHRPDVHGDVVLSGEPSTPHFVRFAEKGPLWVELLVQTPGGHGGYPQVSPNAILMAGEILRELQVLGEIQIRASDDVLARVEESRAKLDELFGDGAADALTHVTVNVGSISGGAKVNMIAADCRVEIDIRTPIGVTSDDVFARVQEIAGRYAGASVGIMNVAESNFCEPDHQLVELIQRNAESSRGIKPIPSLGLGGTDCRLWRYMGIPAFVYGPTPHNMGAPDEYVTIDDLLGTAAVHTLAAYDFLRAG